MKTKTHLLFCLIAILFWTCSKSNDYEPYSVSVDKNSVEFEQEPTASQTINVTTDAERITVDNSAPEWLSVSINDKSINLEATPNTGPARFAKLKIIVTGYNFTEVEVTQNGADGTLEIIIPGGKNNELKVGSGGKERTALKIRSNLPNFSVKSDQEWLKVETDAYSREIIFSIDRNDSTEAREAALTVIAFGKGENKKSETISVTQAGLLTYYLPLIQKNASEAEIKAFEEERGNLPIDKIFYANLSFKSESKQFPFLSYNVNASGNECDLYSTESDKYIKNPETNEWAADFKTFLDKEGIQATVSDIIHNQDFFYKKETDQEIVMMSEYDNYSTRLPSPAEKGAKINIYHPKAPVDLTKHYVNGPTFDKFWLVPDLGFEIDVTPIGDIKKAEIARGNIEREELGTEEMIVFEIKEPEESNPLKHAIRLYFFDTTDSIFKQTLWISHNSEISKVFFNTEKDPDLDPHFTGNFAEVIKKLNFIYLRSKDVGAFFIHKDKGNDNIILVRRVTFSDFPELGEILAINLWKEAVDKEGRALPTKDNNKKLSNRARTKVSFK